MGTKVYAIEYRHAEDGQDYRHDFGTAVRMVALDNGDILLRRAKTSDGALWEDF